MGDFEEMCTLSYGVITDLLLRGPQRSLVSSTDGDPRGVQGSPALRPPLLVVSFVHEHSKDETNIDLRGLERHFWKGTEDGCLGCYDFSGETWAGDGSMHKGVMGAGSICLQRPTCNLVVRVGREEEGVSSLRPELAAMARTLKAAPAESDLIYLCDSEAALNC